ncbi:MAG: hypothetical protein J5688_00575, partial [Paludibacteraceae bacterium]|nr:hypothetical protein [Paludibacteraceae bacterium]
GPSGPLQAHKTIAERRINNAFLISIRILFSISATKIQKYLHICKLFCNFVRESVHFYVKIQDLSISCGVFMRLFVRVRCS